MAKAFFPPTTAIDRVIAELKSGGLVHPDARLNPNAPGGLRREVAYWDLDLRQCLGRSEFEAETVDSALDMLKREGLVPPTAAYDPCRFEAYRALVKERVKGTWTSLSPTMERLIYMLTAVRQPSRMIELGCFWGNTLAWFAGPCLGPDPIYRARQVIGVDPDVKMLDLARENFQRLCPDGADRPDLFPEPGQSVIDRLDDPFDMVYIEAKGDDCYYLPLVQQIYPKLPKGAWVIAHDTARHTMRDELAPYLSWVRDLARFSHSIAFVIDAFGLELSIK